MFFKIHVKSKTWSNRWCLCVFWRVSEQKTLQIPCYLRLASPKPRYLRCFLLLVAKTTVFTVFCGQHLAKTVVFTQFSACCKKYLLFHTFSMPKAQKHCKLQCFGFWNPMKNVRKPTSVQNGASLSSSTKRKCGTAFLELFRARLWPHLPKRAQIRASPPTPPRLASLRLYLYSAQAFGWLS